ncbi:uncharacterized protein LOC130993179 [Salvia miltiorrhiza]|uniref:uncharacterized protein LOC130993179 n=1 Tax=Salvia miltiorrhiza TaxID=226208 RepID=UPI0025AB8867|nr:uncharacterized protein LOC130993179 [Salvia miltiorrhiza]
MSTFHQDSASNEIGPEKSMKPGKTRRSWSVREEEVLLAALKELVVQGWKSDNGFKAGYLGKLQEAVKNAFPGTDLRGTPHIHSKIQTWKKNYASLSYMLTKTGVGFNVDGKYMIDCDTELWNEIVKCDPNASNMRKKSWLYLEEWKEIFGKDRANGTSAEDVVDALHEMNDEDNLDNEGTQGDYHPHFEDEAENEVADDSVCQPQRNSAAAKVLGKKRKANDDSFGQLIEVLGEMSKNADKRADTIAGRIGYEQDLGKARKEVYDQLHNMPTLTMSDRFVAYELLAGDKQGLELFMGLPDEAKPHYVVHILMSKKI